MSKRGIYRRGGALYVRYQDAEGKDVRESTRQTDRRLAEQILAKRKTEVAELRNFRAKKFEKVSFGDLIDIWENAKPSRRVTFKYETPVVRKEFGELRAREVTAPRAEAFLNGLLLSASRKNKYRTILNGIFNDAVARKEYDENPLRGVIHQFAEPPGRERFLMPDEFQKLIARCGDVELRAVVIVLSTTTLRERELINRRWSEIHLNDHVSYVSVPITKTGVPKKVPLPGIAVTALRELPSFGQSDYVFPSRPTARWPKPRKPYRWDFGKKFRELVAAAGIEHVRLHDLRHTGPSLLMMLGVGDGVIAKVTGHRSRMLARYQHLSPALKAQTVDLIARTLTGGKEAAGTATGTAPEKGEEDFAI